LKAETIMHLFPKSDNAASIDVALSDFSQKSAWLLLLATRLI